MIKKVDFWRVTAVVCCLCLFWSGTAAAAMRPVMKKRAGLPPFDVVKTLARGNDDRAPAEADKILCAWLADSSPGLTPDRILTAPAGKMIIARNLSAGLTPSATRTMDVAVNRLHLPVLLITRSSDDDYLARISSRPLPKTISGLRKMLEKEVDDLVGKAILRYRRRVKSGRLVVVGSIFDQANWYGRGFGRLLIININGEKDGTALSRHQATVLLSVDERRLHLGREPAH